MKNRYLLFTWPVVMTFLLSGFVCPFPVQKSINVLIITGGHDFEHKPFYKVFSDLPHIHYDTISQPQANASIASPAVDKYDVLVFYDMFDSLLPAEKQAYVDLLSKRKAMIFLHHSLVSYQGWDEFKKIVGGQYHTSPVIVNGDTLKANYEHDVVMPVSVIDKKHPVTKGINNFEILDEVYGNTEILPTVKPLLGTSQPKSMRYVAWINHYGNSDVLYIQLGHGPSAYTNANYRKLIRQAIEWSAAHHTNSKK